MREKQQPKLLKSDSNSGEQYSHPAYGMVSYFRSQGMTNLVGSEINHQNYVTLKIHSATKYRNLANDRFHSEKQIIEIAMSEQQWASFIASPNTSGVPCTLTRRPDPQSPLFSVPEIDEPNKHDLAQDELKIAAEKITKSMQKNLAELDEIVSSKEAISKVRVRELAKRLTHDVMCINSNLPFHVDMHKEMMEHNVQAAKTDIEGYLNNKIQSLGLKELEKVAPVLRIEKD